MRDPVARFFADLDRHGGTLSLPVIEQWLRATELTADRLADFLVFKPDRYVRNLIYAGPGYQALALCWRNGQRSPIHNHRGSACGVKVLRGVVTETIFAHAPNGMIVATGSRDLSEGSICGSVDEDIHQVSNLQAGGADLVTLHVYAPPLLRMEMFSLDTPAVREWDDPVNDVFILGGGI
ncbi:MAG TPA: cysteine dioxygenase family protein [Gemmataceae bacterium]|jgi:cysteine dioxygenase|nr:cysteine dioxygenase family protein [Gemmataceae bacterium]